LYISFFDNSKILKCQMSSRLFTFTVFWNDVTNIYLFIFWGTPKEITIKFDGKRVIKKCLLNYLFTISMVTL